MINARDKINMQKLDDSSVEIRLTSDHVVAGERISGEVLIKASSIGNKISLEAVGREKLIMTNENGNTESFNQNVFELSAVLCKKTEAADEVFPISIKIPHFAPSSFSMEHSFGVSTGLPQLFTSPDPAVQIKLEIERRLNRLKAVAILQRNKTGLWRCVTTNVVPFF